ncbi:MAG: riboflavin biosynthesis protein RibF [Ruminococcaceae bacterium]|nr:riboflavin biosynthesis protein RibF [Oscillospiraceae bacterium]
MTDTRFPKISFVRLENSTFTQVDKPTAAVYCLGNFDGVHIAHKRLIKEGINEKKRRSDAHSECLCGAFIFRSPSCDYFPPFEGQKKLHLTTLEDKLKMFCEAGLDFVAVCDFEDVRELSPADFLRLLYDGCACRGIVCGYNYSFGKFAKGTPDFIGEYFSDCKDFTLTVVPKISLGGVDVSSTSIRALIAEGNVQTANRLLGYRYFIDAPVVDGKHLGRSLGFPTANQNFRDDAVIPRCGVYATLCRTDKGSFPAVSNVGVRPTVDGDGIVNCETYVIGFSGDLYGESVRVEFIERLRDEIKFSDIHELKLAISRDTVRAQEIFKKV